MNLSLVGPFTPHTSYGIVLNNLAHELSLLSPVKLRDINGNPAFDTKIEKHHDLYEKFDPSGSDVEIVVFHQGMTHQYFSDVANYKVAFPIFELDKFTNGELEDLARADHILVCSEWAKRIVLSHLPDMPVSVVPLGYDPDIVKFNPDPMSFSNKTIFLNVGKWETRKLHDNLANLFRAAFSPTDNVHLLMAPYNFFIGEQENERLKGQYREILGDQVSFLSRIDSHVDFTPIYQMIDVYFGCSRAEGWNLPLFEAMVAGKRVITNNYAGHTQFVSRENSLLINPNRTSLADDGFWFRNGQGVNAQWMEYGQDEFDQIVASLRWCHSERQLNGARNHRDVHDSVSFMTWENSARTILEVLQNAGL